MTRLIFRSPDGQESDRELTSELTVGGGAGNDVVLADPALADLRWRFFLDPRGAPWLEGLGSQAGTLPGGQRVQLAEGAEVALGSWIVRVEPAPVLVVAVPGAPLSYPLAKDRVVVGSGPTADLLIEHPSVSARHAQISRVGDALSLLDLGSASGTFVNGPQVSAAAIEPGDVLRFGDVEVTFAGAPRKPSRAPESEPDPLAEPPEQKGSLRVAVALGALAVLLLALGAGTYFSRGLRPLFSASGQALGGPETAQDLPTDPAVLARRCAAASDVRDADFDPSVCTLVCTQANRASPSLDLARKASRCGSEQRYQGFVREAERLLSAGKEEEARRLIRLIPRNSAMVPRARPVFDEATARLIARTRRACLADVEAGHDEMAYFNSCRRAMELTCNRPQGPDADASKGFRRAARESGRGSGAFTCPRDWEGIGWGKPALSGEDLAALRQKYPRPELAEIAAGYLLAGSPEEALHQLRGIAEWQAKAPPEDLVSFAANVNSLELHQHRLKKLVEEGGDPVPLVSDFDRLVQVERLVLPAGLESPLVQSLRESLLELVRARREYADKAGKAALSFAENRLDPTNAMVAAQASLLEREAARVLSQRPGCEGAREVQAMTLPDSELFRQATQLAKAHGCPPFDPNAP